MGEVFLDGLNRCEFRAVWPTLDEVFACLESMRVVVAEWQREG